MPTAVILKHRKELTDNLVIAQLPNGEEVSFRATSQANAITVLRTLYNQRDNIVKDPDPVVDGPVELDVAVAPKPTDPTPDQIAAQLAQQQWFKDYAQERTQQILATLSADLQSRYKPEYGDLR